MKNFIKDALNTAKVEKEVQVAYIVPSKKREFVQLLELFNMIDEKDYHINVGGSDDELRFDLSKMEKAIYDILKNVVNEEDAFDEAVIFGEKLKTE